MNTDGHTATFQSTRFARVGPDSPQTAWVVGKSQMGMLLTQGQPVQVFFCPNLIPQGHGTAAVWPSGNQAFTRHILFSAGPCWCLPVTGMQLYRFGTLPGSGFGASVYLLLLYSESLTFSVLQLTLVKTQIKEVSCSPWVFSVKLHKILDVLFSWSQTAWLNQEEYFSGILK